jgi:hypothetical protein
MSHPPSEVALAHVLSPSLEQAARTFWLAEIKPIRLVQEAAKAAKLDQVGLGVAELFHDGRENHDPYGPPCSDCGSTITVQDWLDERIYRLINAWVCEQETALHLEVKQVNALYEHLKVSV